MRIQQAARAAGVGPQTLRYYEQRGLMPRVGRRESGYRDYTDEQVRVVRFIRRAQELGFTLEEIGELLKLRGARSPRASVRSLAARRLADLDVRIADLTRMRDALKLLAHRCACGEDPECPILEALEGQPADRGGSR